MTGGVEELRNEDGGYLSWVAAHHGGYVINILYSLNPKVARFHHAACHTILGEPARGTSWTYLNLAVHQSVLDLAGRA